MNKDYHDATSVVDEALIAIADRAKSHLPAEQFPQIEPFLRESYMHVEMDRQTEPAKLQSIQDGLLRVLRDVRLAVHDWKTMLATMRDVIARYSDGKTRASLPIDPDAAAEDCAFLEWINDNHF